MMGLDLNPAQRAAAVVLIVGAVALQGLLWATGTRPIKAAAPLNQPLYTLPEQFGRWKVVEKTTLPHEVMEELDTHAYLHWVVRDTTRPADAKDAVLRLHVVYHTGWPDTQPHVKPHPFLHGPSASDRTTPDATHTLGWHHAIDDARPPVASLFIANGQQVEAAAQVERIIADPATRVAWWARVEIQAVGTDFEQAKTQQVIPFLDVFMPALKRCLPDS